MTELSFANKLYAHLAEGITSGQTTIPIVPGDMGNIWAGFKPGVYLYLVIMNELGQKEIVKVTGVNKNNMLTVQRGQGGTTARAFAIGSPITERTIAEQASYMIQRGIFRQGNYNPNTILTGEFNGEKFWQTGPAADQKRWWINAGGGDRWRLMSGDLYGYEYRDAEGFIIAPPQWAEVAPMYGGTEYNVRPILVYGSDVFGVSSQYWPHANGGKLLMWNGVDAWVEKAPKLGFADSLGLCQHGAELLACTDTGILQRWNGVNLWVSVIGAPHLQSFTYIYSYGSHLYAVDSMGAIKLWNDVNGWAADPPQVPFGMYIGGNGLSVVEIGGSIFAQGNTSAIYEWDGGAMWLEDIPAIGFNILNMVSVLGMLYGIDATGQLFKLDYGAGTATSVAPAPAGTTINVIFNFLDEIYGADSTTGRLYKWNGTDAWDLAAYEKAAPRSPVIHMTSLGLDVFGSTVDGALYQCAP